MNERQDHQQPSDPIVQFQQDVLHNHTDQIHAFINALAKEGKNKYLLELANAWNIKSFWDEQVCDGHRLILASDLASRCYNTENSASLRQLLNRQNLPLFSIHGGSVYNTLRLQLIEYFGLSKYTSQINLATYDHVMVAAVSGDTLSARTVWADEILPNLTYALADKESRRQTGLGAVDNAAQQLGNTQADLPSNIPWHGLKLAEGVLGEMPAFLKTYFWEQIAAQFFPHFQPRTLESKNKWQAIAYIAMKKNEGWRQTDMTKDLAQSLGQVTSRIARKKKRYHELEDVGGTMKNGRPVSIHTYPRDLLDLGWAHLAANGTVVHKIIPLPPQEAS